MSAFGGNEITSFRHLGPKQVEEFLNFVLRSTKQFTYRIIPVFHWNDDSGKRPESF